MRTKTWLVAVFLGLAWTAPASAARLAFVINSNDASIMLIDVDTESEIKTIPLLREPHHMALSPDHRSLLVGDTTGNTMFFFDPRTGDLQKQMTISDPYQFVFSPDGRFLTIAGLARNQIDIYDAATMHLLHRIPAWKMPSHINYSPDSSRVFVSLQETDSLIAIATETGQVQWTAKVGKTPAGVLWHNGKLLVGIMGENHVAVVDPAQGHVDRVIPTGRGAHVLFVPPDRKVIYVTNRVDGTVSVLDPASLNVLRTLTIPGGPDDMDFAPDGKIWATLRWRQEVAIIDPLTGAEQTIRVSRSPHGIWLNTHDALPATVSSK